jgi:hypothetical protein
MSESTVEYESKLQEKSLVMVDSSKKLKIVDEASYLIAGQLKHDIDKEIKFRKEYFELMRQKAKAAYDEVLDKRREATEPLENAMKIINCNMSEYLTKKEEERRAEQVKLEAEAIEKAKKEREKLLKKAATAKTQEKIEELLSKAEGIYPEPQFVNPYIPKKVTLEGGGSVEVRKDIEVKITNEIDFLRQVVELKAPTTLISFEYGKIKAWVKANNYSGAQVPGLAITEILKPITRA